MREAQSGLAGKGMIQPDLFVSLLPTCGECAMLGEAIESGVRYCHGTMMWIWTDERRPCARRTTVASIAQEEPVGDPWLAAATDLLTHPRHSLTPEGRAWLTKEKRDHQRAARSA